MASLLKNIAEPYNKDKVYNTKDMVLYNNLLYLCIYNNVSGEFNSSKWIEVQLTDLVQGKLRGIEDYSGKVIDASYVEQDDDYTYFGVPQKAFVDNETSFRTLNSNLNKLDFGEFVKYTNSSEISQISLTDLEVGSIYEMVIHTSKINCEITAFIGCEELEYSTTSTSYSGRQLILANFKATSDSVTLSLTGSGLVTYILRKLT